MRSEIKKALIVLGIGIPILIGLCFGILLLVKDILRLL